MRVIFLIFAILLASCARKTTQTQTETTAMTAEAVEVASQLHAWLRTETALSLIERQSETLTLGPGGDTISLTRQTDRQLARTATQAQSADTVATRTQTRSETTAEQTQTKTVTKPPAPSLRWLLWLIALLAVAGAIVVRRKVSKI